MSWVCNALYPFVFTSNTGGECNTSDWDCPGKGAPTKCSQLAK